MDFQKERRSHKRERLSWPLWFGHGEFEELSQGQLVNLSRNGVSFTVNSDLSPAVGQHLFTRFSYPDGPGGSFEMNRYYHWSEVLRVENTGPGRNRIAMRLHELLPRDPSSKASAGMALQPI